MQAPDGWTLKTWADVLEGMADVEARIAELTAATSSAEPARPEQVLAMVAKAQRSLRFVEAAAAWDRAAV